jgi:hypothetical protein
MLDSGRSIPGVEGWYDWNQKEQQLEEWLEREL